MKHFPFESFIKIKDIHFTRNLHNFVYDITDAWHGTFRFLVKTESQTNFFSQTNLLGVIILNEKQKYDERCQVFM